jgi:hypothetical protein
MNLPGWPYLVSIGLFVAASFALASPQETNQSRLDWNLKMIVGAYQQFGNTNAAWDEPAIRALTEFARHDSDVIQPGEPWEDIISTNCNAAIKAGCNDTMMRYLSILFCMSQSTNSPKDFAVALHNVAFDMQKSLYPNMRKLAVEIAALEQIYKAYGYTNAETISDMKELSPHISENLQAVLADKTTPPEDVFWACDKTLKIFDWQREDYIEIYSMMEPLLVSNWHDESIRWLLTGEAYVQMAWNARGYGLASTVTREGFKTFENDLAIAESALNQAWKLNPQDARIAVEMMTLELGQGEGRDRMELWFDRAMKIDPNDYDACSQKFYYLEPKWYGSLQDMLDFGHECVLNTNWGGHVPLILVDVHSTIWGSYTDKSGQTNYLKQAVFLHDIQAAYDRFFELNPNETTYYKNYAWYAYHAEQWEKFVELAPKITPEHYGFFGGKTYFDQMVQYANRMIRYNRRQGIVTPQ